MSISKAFLLLEAIKTMYKLMCNYMSRKTCFRVIIIIVLLCVVLLLLLYYYYVLLYIIIIINNTQQAKLYNTLYNSYNPFRRERAIFIYAVNELNYPIFEVKIHLIYLIYIHISVFARTRKHHRFSSTIT